MSLWCHVARRAHALWRLDLLWSGASREAHRNSAPFRPRIPSAITLPTCQHTFYIPHSARSLGRPDASKPGASTPVSSKHLSPAHSPFPRNKSSSIPNPIHSGSSKAVGERGGAKTPTPSRPPTIFPATWATLGTRVSDLPGPIPYPCPKRQSRNPWVAEKGSLGNGSSTMGSWKNPGCHCGGASSAGTTCTMADSVRHKVSHWDHNGELASNSGFSGRGSTLGLLPCRHSTTTSGPTPSLEVHSRRGSCRNMPHSLDAACVMGSLTSIVSGRA
mmetsp:Transcript_32423/g.87007  ORF Transcript_32423/g.87007 Transcript_32423/m.87007 type:complete len:274 (+) Transcript_32423:240-1061(+)